jgi:hypothetical protein
MKALYAEIQREVTQERQTPFFGLFVAGQSVG